MKKKHRILSSFFLIFLISACCMSCFNQMSDSLITIKQLRRLHQMGEVEAIKQEWAVQAVVVGNDEYDNWYKAIVIQDSTGGIMLLLDGQNLYQDFPVGALIKLRSKG